MLHNKDMLNADQDVNKAVSWTQVWRRNMNWRKRGIHPIAISIYFHVTCQGRSGWVQKLRQRRLFTLKTATCHLCARESFAWRLAWLQAKTGFKVNLKMIQAADHVTFLRARNSPRAEQSKKIIHSLLRLLHHHYKNLPVSLLPSSNDQLWAHYR